MLRFIVLGEIPGTNISLTFFQTLLILAGLYGALWLAHEYHQAQRQVPVRIEDIAL